MQHNNFEKKKVIKRPNFTLRIRSVFLCFLNLMKLIAKEE